MFAHSKWFIDAPERFPLDLGALTQPAVVIGLLAVGLLAAAYATVLHAGWLRVPAVPGPIARYLIPSHRPVAVAVGGLLVYLASAGGFLAPNLVLDEELGQLVVRVAQATVGLWLISGYQARGAAMALGGLITAGAVLFGPLAMVEAAHLAGAAVFIAIAAHGGLHDPARREAGGRALRWGLAVALLAAALTEKLLAPGLTLAILDAHPVLQLPSALAGAPSLLFVQGIGAIEVLVALIIARKHTPPLVLLTLTAPFIAAVPLFGLLDLVGHLPPIAALFTLAALSTAPVPVAVPSGAVSTERELVAVGVT